MPENSVRPRKRPARTSATAASVPSTVAAVADSAAMRRLVQAASSMARSCQQRDVPARRPAAPDRDQPRGVERIDHQDRDRQIEERKAERDRGDVEDRGLAHQRSSERAHLQVLIDQDRHQQDRQQRDGDRGRHRPVLVLEELGPQRLADHQRVRAAEQIGDDELAGDRDEAQQRAGEDARTPTAAR